MFRRLIDKIIYKKTQKPTCYKEVRNPPQNIISKLLHPQEARQIQYNNWCKAKKVYCGSYLPKNDKTLLKKGWEEKKNTNNDRIVYQRKSTGQTIRCESHNQPRHYHWLDFWESPFINSRYKQFQSKEFGGQHVYYNKYGELTHRGDPEHHIYGGK